MNKSLLLLASFAGLVACFGEKKEPAQDGQTTESTCPADTAPAVAPEEKKAEEATPAPAATETPSAEPTPAAAQ